MDVCIPKVNGLGTNWAVPEASEATWAGGGGSSSAGICLTGSEEGSEAAEDAGAWSERHGCCIAPAFSLL